MRERSSSRSAEHSLAARTSPESELARSRKPQNPVAAIAPSPVVMWIEARTPETRTEPLVVWMSIGTLSGTVRR